MWAEVPLAPPPAADDPTLIIGLTDQVLAYTQQIAQTRLAERWSTFFGLCYACTSFRRRRRQAGLSGWGMGNLLVSLNPDPTWTSLE